MKIKPIAATAVALATAGTSMFLAIPGAFASAGHPPTVYGHIIDIGPSPDGIGNCTFANNDASFFTVTGNAVAHDTSNANGDWGGLTFTGTAIMREAPYSGFDTNGNPIDTGAPVPMYSGHLTYWNGGGNNSTGQTEGGATLDFHGTSLTGSGTLDIHVTFHGTTSASGQMVGNVQNVVVSCS